MSADHSSTALLDALVALSREFGGPDYVRGGGGNTSVKTADTIWVKPSGTTLAGLTADRLVAMDRSRLARLYTAAAPLSPPAREALVKEMMAAAVLGGSNGRPSVEAPLHDTFSTRFVVHTHPALVNGMTCAMDGEAVCRRLFPDALWMPYVDPGYTLCMEVRKAMLAYKRRRKSEPAVVMLQNHGVFIAGDTPDEVRALYSHVMSSLRAEDLRRGIEVVWKPPPAAPGVVEVLARQAKDALGGDAAAATASGPFSVAEGPISPDHIVYARSYPLHGLPTPDAVLTYRRRYGYAPRVIVTDEAVLGVGANPRTAALALELAQDGAMVCRLAEVFGGIRYLSDDARLFIENWEVESYRQQVVSQ